MFGEICGPTPYLPPDDTAYGFHTIGEVLTLSPFLMEKYLAPALRVGDGVVAESSAGRKGRTYPAALRQLFPYGPPPDDDAAKPEHLRRTLRELAERAFRRPVDEPTVNRLEAVASEGIEAAGGSFLTGHLNRASGRW